MISSMEFILEFNKEITKEKYHISPGSYEMKFNGQTIRFDFLDFFGKVLEDKKMLYCYVEHPDYESFKEDNKKIEIDKLEEIIEFYVYMADFENEENTELEVIAVHNCYIYDDKAKIYKVPNEILSKVSFDF